MISKYSHKELKWIDLEASKEGELTYIEEEYSLPKFIRDELSSKTKNDIINLDNDVIYVAINLPYHSVHEFFGNRIIFIVSDDFIITIHDEPIYAWEKFKNDMEIDALTDGKLNMNNHKLLFTYLIKHLFVDAQDKLSNNYKQILNFENHIKSKNKKIRLFKKLFITSLSIIIILILILCL